MISSQPADYPKQAELLAKYWNPKTHVQDELAKRLKKKPSSVSKILNGRRRATEEFLTVFAAYVGISLEQLSELMGAQSRAAIGASNDHFVSEFISSLIATRILRATDRLHQGTATKKDLFASAIEDIPSADDLCAAIRLLFEREARLGTPSLFILWTARHYIDDERTVRNLLYNSLIRDFVRDGGQVTHIMRAPSRDLIDTTIRFQSAARMRFAEFRNYRIAQGRHVVANDRPMDLYVARSAGAVLAFTLTPGAEPDMGLAISQGKKKLVALQQYINQIDVSARDPISFYHKERLNLFHRDVVPLLHAMSDLRVVSAIAPSFTRPVGDLNQSSDWGRRVLRQKKKEGDRGFNFDAYVEQRKSAFQHFYDRLGKSSIRIILCREALEAWAGTGKRYDEPMDAERETPRERTSRLRHLQWLMTHHKCLEIAIVPENEFRKLPGLQEFGPILDIGWSVLNDQTVVLEVADQRPPDPNGVYKLIVNEPEISTKLVTQFDVAWSRLRPADRDQRHILNEIQRLMQIVEQERQS